MRAGHSIHFNRAVSPGWMSVEPSGAKVRSPEAPEVAGCTGTPSWSNATGVYVPALTSAGLSSAATRKPDLRWMPQLSVWSQA